MIERQDSKEINIGGEIAGKKTIPKKKDQKNMNGEKDDVDIFDSG